MPSCSLERPTHHLCGPSCSVAPDVRGAHPGSHGPAVAQTARDIPL